MCVNLKKKFKCLLQSKIPTKYNWFGSLDVFFLPSLPFHRKIYSLQFSVNHNCEWDRAVDLIVFPVNIGLVGSFYIGLTNGIPGFLIVCQSPPSHAPQVKIWNPPFKSYGTSFYDWTDKPYVSPVSGTHVTSFRDLKWTSALLFEASKLKYWHELPVLNSSL